MSVDRAPILDRKYVEFFRNWAETPVSPRDPEAAVGEAPSLVGRTLLELFESQLIARHLDLEARALKRRNVGFYTIGSLGHEGNVALGRCVRATDPTFLHYRSGALMVERARQVPGSTPIFDVLLSLVASSDDPISGGRHKVFGSVPLWVPPQTSTIASHLPKAVGAAFAIERAKSVKHALPVPADSIVLCNFGDASLNHNVSQGAFNAASWAAHQNLPVPILFVCEDNGIGISVRTPENWVARRLASQPGFRVFTADGLNLTEAYTVAEAAARYAREERRPTFLHLRTVRLLGHAGTDMETEYLTKSEIEAQEDRDPLLVSAAQVIRAGLLTAEGVLALYEEIRARVGAGAKEAVSRPKLTSAAVVMETLAPFHPEAIAAEAIRPPDPERRLAAYGGADQLPEKSDRPRPLAVQINRALQDALVKYPEMLVFGEDVAKKGGVYHVTADLAKKAGLGRVFNTLLDETTILGLAIGAAHLGFLPVPEIQYLAYLHNAEDQLRGEACSLQFFSNGQFRNPMVVRIASLGYQKGFGGHFHNDNSTAVLRDIPGLIVAVPSSGDDAARMLRSCLAASKVDGRVVAFLEPIALYAAKDLHEDGDNRYLTLYPPLDEVVPIGAGRTLTEGSDCTIITYGNGVYLSLRAARVLEREFGVKVRIVDLRWLAPLDEELMVSAAEATGRVLVVDEGRRSGGVGEPVLAAIALRMQSKMPKVARLSGEDTYIPLGPAANTVLPTEEKIVSAVRELCAEAVPAGRRRRS